MWAQGTVPRFQFRRNRRHSHWRPGSCRLQSLVDHGNGKKGFFSENEHVANRTGPAWKREKAWDELWPFFFLLEYSWSSTKLFFLWLGFLIIRRRDVSSFFFFLKTKIQKYRVQFVINIISAHFWYSFHSQKFNYPLKDLPYFHFSPNISIEKKGREKLSFLF